MQFYERHSQWIEMVELYIFSERATLTILGHGSCNGFIVKAVIHLCRGVASLLWGAWDVHRPLALLDAHLGNLIWLIGSENKILNAQVSSAIKSSAGGWSDRTVGQNEGCGTAVMALFGNLYGTVVMFGDGSLQATNKSALLAGNQLSLCSITLSLFNR